MKTLARLLLPLTSILLLAGCVRGNNNLLVDTPVDKATIADKGHANCNTGNQCESGLICVDSGTGSTACYSECQLEGDCGTVNKYCINSTKKADGSSVKVCSPVKPQPQQPLQPQQPQQPVVKRSKSEIADTGHFNCLTGDTCEEDLTCVSVGGGVTACASSCQGAGDCGAKNSRCIVSTRKSDGETISVCMPHKLTQAEIADSAYENCGDGNTCDNGMICVEGAFGKTKCVAECQGNWDCGAVNRYCVDSKKVSDGTSVKVCAPHAPRSKAEIADTGHTKCLSGNTCEEGLTCVYTDSFGANGCYAECKSRADCGFTNGFCVPKNKPGSSGRTWVCSSTQATKAEIADAAHKNCLEGNTCAPGLVCADTEVPAEEACVAECTTNGDCGKFYKYCVSMKKKNGWPIKACSSHPPSAVCTPSSAMNATPNPANHKVEYPAFAEDKGKEWPESQKPIVATDATGVTTMVFSAGYKEHVTADLKHSYYYRFIDFDANDVINISDVEGFDADERWEIAIKNFVIYLNAHNSFSGEVKAAMITESATTTFGSFTLSDAQALSATQFKGSNLVNFSTCRVAMIDRSGLKYYLPNSAFMDLNIGIPPFKMPFDYHMGSHTPRARDGYFYVLKNDSRPGWFYKFKFVTIQYDDAKNFTKYTISYKKL